MNTDKCKWAREHEARPPYWPPRFGKRPAYWLQVVLIFCGVVIAPTAWSQQALRREVTSLGGPTTYGDLLTPAELARIEVMAMDSPPTPPVSVADTRVPVVPMAAVLLSEVPRSTWTYGCSATLAIVDSPR